MVLSNWLYQINCTAEPLNTDIERGIVDGKLDMDSYTSPVLCPNINFFTLESMCWDVTKLMTLPARGQRNGSPFSLFTILREPLQRIGSQAFYSRGVVGIQTIVHFIVRKCHEYISGVNRRTRADDAFQSYERCKDLEVHGTLDESVSEDKLRCSCMFDAHRLAMAELKSNETLWFDWFEHSRRQASWYHNLYKKNYYLERMFGGESLLYNEYYNTTFHAALRCLNRGCDEGVANLNVLHELSTMSFCVENQFPSPITEDTLPLAKQLLRSHIDFIIMEKYSEYSTAGAIASVLGADQRDIAQALSSQHAGAGKFSSSISYRDLMPPSVVKYLEAENAWDIEFYHYAVKVIEERAATEGWNHKRALMLV
jgi:hypothetical protein